MNGDETSCMKCARLLPALLVAGCATLSPPPESEVVGYLAGWKAPIEMDLSALTVVNYAFLDLCFGGLHGNPTERALKPCLDAAGRAAALADGAIVLDDPARDAAWFERLR